MLGDIKGLKVIKDRMELGRLGLNMYAGEGPHVRVVLRWFIKVHLWNVIAFVLSFIVMNRYLVNVLSLNFRPVYYKQEIS